MAKRSSRPLHFAPACLSCGAVDAHHALCPVPSVDANPNRVGVREIAISDYIDVALLALAKLPPEATEVRREVLIDAGSLILNAGLRAGYSQAEGHALALAAAHVPKDVDLAARLAQHRPR